MPELNLVQVTAVEAFTVTTKHGQFHGDPDNRSDKVKHPMVPALAVDDLIAQGKAKAYGVKAKAAPKSAAPKAAKQAEPSPHSGDLGFLRSEYRKLVGKGASPRLDAAALAARIEQLKANPDELAKVKASAPAGKPKKTAKAKTPAVETDAPVD
jgi:hypothetical protein